MDFFKYFSKIQLISLIYCLTYVNSSAPVFTNYQLQKLFNITNTNDDQRLNAFLGIKIKNQSKAIQKWNWDYKIKGYRIPYTISTSYPKTISKQNFQRQNKHAKLPRSIAANIPIKNELQKNIDIANSMFAPSTFIKLVPKESSDKDFIEIIYNERSNSIYKPGECWSNLGRLDGRQRMALGWCFYDPALIVHEFMHALGFLHEHQRHDRDNFITMDVSKISERSFKINCDKKIPQPGFEDISTAGTEYDYYSIMHYPLRTEQCGIMKIVDQGIPITETDIGHQKQLSEADIKAINYHYKEQLFKCRTNCCEPTRIDGYGRNCFHIATISGDIETLKYLDLNYPGLKKTKDNGQDTALTLAAAFGDRNTVQFLIEEVGMSPFETGHNGNTCFISAAYGGKIETLKYLNSKNYPGLKNARNHWQHTALTIAALTRDKDTVKFLIEEVGMSPLETGYHGENCFLSAARGGKVETLKYLISKTYPGLENARTNYHDTALTLAAQYSDKDTVQFLIEDVGMNVTETGEGGRNCFLWAAFSGKIETLKYLNSRYPELKNGKDYYKDTALTLAARLPNKATVQFLIEEVGMNVTQIGFAGRNCFLLAAAGGKIETLKYLNYEYPGLKHGKDIRQSTALTLAAFYADKATVEFLIDQVGMNVAETGNGRNCFLWAASGGKIETLKYLNSKNPELKHGKDQNKDTALTLAARNSDKDTVQFLIEEVGMSPFETGYNGNNCFISAAFHCKVDTLKYLNSLEILNLSALKNGRLNDGDSALDIFKRNCPDKMNQVNSIFY